MMRRAWPALVLLAVSVPTLRWAWARFFDGTENAVIGMLAPLVVLSARRREPGLDLRICAALVFLLALTRQLGGPDLLLALLTALAWSSLGSCWRDGRPWSWPLAGLFTLALPMLSSLQFFLGYPMRWLSTRVAAVFLSGHGVQTSGAALICGQRLVSVDAPCSGLHMLWSAYLLVFGLALQRRWRARELAGVCLATGVTLVLVNGWRAAALFYLEALPRHPVWLHEGTGVVLFAAFAALCVRYSPAPRAEPPAVVAHDRGCIWFQGAAALALLSRAPATGAPPPVTMAKWTSFEGRPLRQLAKSSVEERFYADFPGAMQRYTDGEREIIVRFVTGKTRRLHPAAECLLANGFTISNDRPEEVDGRLWHSFKAVHKATQLQVRERIEETSGRGWNDVSEWLWSRSEGPWWAVTVSEPLSVGGKRGRWKHKRTSYSSVPES